MRINSLWLLAALFLFVPVVQVTSLVLGIDLGSHYFKLAVVRPGGVEIVENEKSGRKTPLIVAFRELDEVFVGDPAAQVSSRNPSLTFPFLKEISGRERALVDVLQHWGPVLPYKERLGLDEEGRVTVSLKDLQMTGVNEGVMPTNYTTTELLAILFGRISQLTDRFVGSHVIDCVIAVPHWLDQSTRAEITFAAEAAGLKVLSLQSDLGAISVHYAMNRRAEGDESASHVLFVDQGETHAQFGVVSFAKDTKNSNKATHFSQATVKSVEWVEVGGRDLDNAILNHVIAKYGVKGLEERPRTLALARKQVKRAKEVLTANKEAHFTVENMHGEGRDLTGVVTREEFEQVTAALYSHVTAAIDRALAAANVTAEQLYAVELVGGSTRVPKFQELLKQHLQRDTLDKHLNGDEAAVLGAAMSAASLSTQHRLSRKIALKDLNSYPVQAKIATALADDAINGKEMFLFTEHHRLGSKKTVSFLTSSDTFDIHLSYNLTGDRKVPVGVSPNLATYRISEIPLKDQNGEPIRPKVHVAFKMTSSGIVTCDSAEAEYTVTIDTPVVDEAKNSDEKQDSEAKSGDAENGNTAENSEANNGDEGSEANNSNESEGQDSEETAQNGNEQATKSVKTRVVRVNLKVTAEGPIVRSVKQATAAAAKLKSLQAAQKEREEIDSLHNQIESLLYETRDQINDPTTKLVKFSYAHERAALNEVLDSVSTWMDDVMGVKVSKADLKARIKSIEGLVTPVKDRALQLDRRTEHVSQCYNVLNLTRTVVTGNLTAVRNVTEEEVAELFALVDETAQWLETRVKEQTARDELVASLHAQLMQGSDSSTWGSEHGEYLSPVISSAEIAEKCALVQARTRLLIMRPKRVPKKETESATEANNSNATGDSTQQEGETRGEEPTNQEPAEQQTNQEQAEQPLHEQKDEL